MLVISTLCVITINAAHSPFATYDQRVDTLTASGGLLEPVVTVFNDSAIDVFIGGGGLDLYFADLDASNGNADVLLLTRVLEQIESVDP